MRAISKNTRKATAITLAAALVIAVYLNWQYARTGVIESGETLEVSAASIREEIAASAPITDGLMTEAEAVSSANKNYGEAQLVSVANDSGSKFFEEARLKRTKAHGCGAKSAEILVTFGRGKEKLYPAVDRQSGRSERRKRNRDVGACQGVCGLPVLFAVRPG